MQILTKIKNVNVTPIYNDMYLIRNFLGWNKHLRGCTECMSFWFNTVAVVEHLWVIALKLLTAVHLHTYIYS